MVTKEFGFAVLKYLDFIERLSYPEKEYINTKLECEYSLESSPLAVVSEVFSTSVSVFATKPDDEKDETMSATRCMRSRLFSDRVESTGLAKKLKSGISIHDLLKESPHRFMEKVNGKVECRYEYKPSKMPGIDK